MDLELNLSLNLYHLLVSLIPWGIATVVGGGLGYVLAVLLRRWFQNHPHGINYLVLLPWRSIVIWVAHVLIYSPSFLIWQFGLGPFSTGLTVGIVLSLLIIPTSVRVFMRSIFPPNLKEDAISIVRLAAILSIVLTVFLNDGVGYYLNRASSTNDFQKMGLGYEIVGVMLLGIDLLFGLIQFRFLNSQKSK